MRKVQSLYIFPTEGCVHNRTYFVTLLCMLLISNLPDFFIQCGNIIAILISRKVQTAFAQWAHAILILFENQLCKLFPN